MRSSPPRSTSLTLVTKEPASGATAPALSEQASRESAAERICPCPKKSPGLWRLVCGLRSTDWNRRIRPKNLTENIAFHRIVGRSETGSCSAALLYFDQQRLDRYRDPWFVYSLCIRLCKHFGNSGQDTLGIAFLAPDAICGLYTWMQQGEDIEDLNIVRAVRFRHVAHPATWTSGDAQTAMQNVKQWVGKLDLRPLAEIADTFSARHESPHPLSDQPHEASVHSAPAVFVSYSKDDEKWLDVIRRRSLRWRSSTAVCGRSGTATSKPAPSGHRPSKMRWSHLRSSFSSSANHFCRPNTSRTSKSEAGARCGRRGQEDGLVGICEEGHEPAERLNRWQAAHDPKTPLERVIDVQSRETQLLRLTMRSKSLYTL